jgi:hypothetical protein
MEKKRTKKGEGKRAGPLAIAVRERIISLIRQNKTSIIGEKFDSRTKLK